MIQAVSNQPLPSLQSISLRSQSISPAPLDPGSCTACPRSACSARARCPCGSTPAGVSACPSMVQATLQGFKAYSRRELRQHCESMRTIEKKWKRPPCRAATLAQHGRVTPCSPWLMGQGVLHLLPAPFSTRRDTRREAPWAAPDLSPPRIGCD